MLPSPLPLTPPPPTPHPHPHHTRSAAFPPSLLPLPTNSPLDLLFQRGQQRSHLKRDPRRALSRKLAKLAEIPAAWLKRSVNELFACLFVKLCCAWRWEVGGGGELGGGYLLATEWYIKVTSWWHKILKTQIDDFFSNEVDWTWKGQQGSTLTW